MAWYISYRNAHIEYTQMCFHLFIGKWVRIFLWIITLKGRSSKQNSVHMFMFSHILYIITNDNTNQWYLLVSSSTSSTGVFIIYHPPTSFDGFCVVSERNKRKHRSEAVSCYDTLHGNMILYITWQKKGKLKIAFDLRPSSHNCLDCLCLLQG